MTDDLLAHGLGALPDPPDERDYPLSALYAAEGIEPSVTLPASYAAPGMPPVLDQRATPMCVAYSSSAMKAWQDKRDQERLFDFDEPRFFREIGGTAAGAYVRDAMDRMRAVGYPLVGTGDAGHHRIAAYYAVPRDPAAINAAIHDLGPVVVSTPWHQSWFRPRADGTLPAPDSVVGGHAIVAYGWDQRGLRLRNSWGAGWGIGGDCWMPDEHVLKINGAWKAADAIEHPIPYAHTVDVTARPSLNVRKAPTTAAARVGSLPRGRDVATLRLEKYGGRYSVSGAVRTDWLEVKAGTRTGWVARGYTRLVKQEDAMEDLTLAVVLTAAGATASAALITGLIAIAKQLVVVGPWINADREPTVAFVLSALLVTLAVLSTGGFTPAALFGAFLAWFGIAQIAMGVHDTVKSATAGAG